MSLLCIKYLLIYSQQIPLLYFNFQVAVNNLVLYWMKWCASVFFLQLFLLPDWTSLYNVLTNNSRQLPLRWNRIRANKLYDLDLFRNAVVKSSIYTCHILRSHKLDWFIHGKQNFYECWHRMADVICSRRIWHFMRLLHESLFFYSKVSKKRTWTKDPAWRTTPTVLNVK